MCTEPLDGHAGGKRVRLMVPANLPEDRRRDAVDHLRRHQVGTHPIDLL
jgi:hypothetical protein